MKKPPHCEKCLEYKRWYDAVQDALVVSWQLNQNTAENPVSALAALVGCAEDWALDPKISSRAAALRDTYLEYKPRRRK